METVAPGIRVFPVRSPTLPPATHTNTYVLGNGELTLVDPASPWADEQERLAAALERLVAAGERVVRVFLTHHHGDHVGGALAAARDWSVPIAAHPKTRELLAEKVAVDEIVEGNTAVAWGGRRYATHHTPGHAPGHLVLQDTDTAAMIAGDMVAGVGTIAISPEDGDLGQYLASLQQMRELAPTVLLPAHGPPLRQADAVLSHYIAHRHYRTDQIRKALTRLGRRTPLELTPEIYPELPVEAHPLAAAQILSHLRWMRAHGLAAPADEVRWQAH